MNREEIQSYIAKARIERSVVLGMLIAEAIAKGWRMVRRAADGLRPMIEGVGDYLPRSQA
jgi:hypothetical protein